MLSTGPSPCHPTNTKTGSKGKQRAEPQRATRWATTEADYFDGRNLGLGLRIYVIIAESGANAWESAGG